MHRLILIALALAACNSSEASKPSTTEPSTADIVARGDAIVAEIQRLKAIEASAVKPRNLVCERVAILSPKATCAPELSGVGDLATHTARVTPEGAKTAIVCGLNAGQLSMACGTLEVQPAPKQDENFTTTETPEAKAMKSAKGKK